MFVDEPLARWRDRARGRGASGGRRRTVALASVLVAVFAIPVLFLSRAPLGLVTAVCACGGGGGGGGGDDGGGGGGDDGGDDGGGDGDGGSASADVAPAGFKPKLTLIPWLAGDWSRDGSGEKRTRDMVSKIKSIDRLLPYRGGPGQPFDPLTAPKWDDRFAIRWHIAPITFFNTGPSPTSPPSSSMPSSPPPPASPRREGRDEDSGTTDPGGVPIGGTTPALLREMSAVPRSTRPLNDPKMMEQAWAEMKRQEEVERGIAARAEAARHERNAVIGQYMMAGAESLQQTAAITIGSFVIAVGVVPAALGISTTAGAVALGSFAFSLKGAMTLAEGYVSYHEMTTRRDNPLTPEEAMKAAAMNTSAAIALDALGSLGGGVVTPGTTKALNKGLALAMSNRSRGAQIVTQVGMRTGLNLGIGKGWNYVSTEFSDMSGWGKAKK